MVLHSRHKRLCSSSLLILCCLLCLSLLLTLGCASGFHEPDPVPINYRMRDIPVQHRIELIYRNDSTSDVCLSSGNWPNPAGNIDQASGYVFLKVGAMRFPIKEFNEGYCPGGCGVRVSPGEQLLAFIPYSAFGVPEDLVGEEKTLEFSPVGFKCN